MTELTTLSLADALDTAIRRYRAANPVSERLQARAAEVMPGGNTRSVLFYPPFPLYMASGQGCRLRDADGHDYLDALGEFTAGLFGHSDPVIRRALDLALDRGLNLSSHTPGEAALAHEIRRRFPAMQLLRFTNSGTEANLLALAAATTHTGRRKVMVFEGGYHGGVLTFGAGSASVNVPHEFVRVGYNDLTAAREAVALHGRELAAILVEPMLGSGGCIAGTPEFLHGLRALANECGALLVFDEVMTSRLSIGGRQALLGITPDLTTLGKYFGGGMSIGVFGGRAELIARFDPRRADALGHAGTFNNNVLTMAAGLAGLTEVLTEPALAALNRRGDNLRERLNALFAERGVALQASGLGSLLTLHATERPLRSAADLAGIDPRIKELIFFDLLERGIWMARRGFMALSLPFGEAQVDQLVAALADVVEARRELLPRRAD
ncbi:MAG: aminotransferase class III-fold pyridoxal phosphate-dependent enzyme [Burkholderiaceae bacterium]|nr:aminotransferase class III-fold pyridoxal phosphate-dependent enzyme [Burkholderiaceae bacterium]